MHRHHRPGRAGLFHRVKVSLAEPPQTLLILLPPRRKLAIVGAILLTLFLASLDQTVVGTALPRIITDLNGANLYAWVVTVYLLTSTITVPIYGKFSDVFGRKVMLMIGVALFLIGSWLSGASQTMTELILFRAIQGLGAGALFPIVIAIIADLYSPREQGRFQGLFGAVFGLSFIVVPLIIGLSNKGYVNSQGQLPNWTDLDVGGLIILGMVILVGFVFVELRAKEPIIPLDLFRGRDYSVSMAAVFVFGIAMFAAVLFMPRFYQTVRGISATASGYYIWPLLLGLTGGSIGAGLLISRIGRYKWLMVGGGVLMVIGGYLLTRLTADISDWTLWAYMLILGFGIGPSLAAFTVVIQNLVPLKSLGVATSTLTFFRQIGASVGLAVAGTVFSTQFANRLPKTLTAHGVPEQAIPQLVNLSELLQNVGNGQAILDRIFTGPAAGLIPKIIAAANESFSLAIGDLFWVTVIAGAAGLAFTLVLQDLPLRSAREIRAEVSGAQRELPQQPAVEVG